MKKLFLTILLLILVSIASLYFYLKFTTEYIYTTIGIETPSGNLENILDTQTEIIKSQAIITKALQELNISSTKLSSIQQRVFVERVKHSSILKISISKQATPQAKNILNSIANIYTTHYNQESTNSQLVLSNTIDNRLQTLKQSINDLALRLEKFREENHYIVTTTVAQKRVNTLEILNKRLLKITIELDILKRVSRQLQTNKNIERLLVAGLYSSKERENKILEESIRQLQQSIIQMKILLGDYTKEYPEVIKLKRKILELKKITLTIIKNNQKSYKQEKRLLQEYIKKERVFIEKIPSSDRVVTSFKEQLYSKRKLYNTLLEKKLNLTLKQTKSSRAYIVDKNREESYRNYNFYLRFFRELF